MGKAIKGTSVSIKLSESAATALVLASEANKVPISTYVLGVLYGHNKALVNSIGGKFPMPEVATRGRKAKYVNADGTPMSAEQKKIAVKAERDAAKAAADIARRNSEQLTALRDAARKMRAQVKGGKLGAEQMQALMDMLNKA